MTLKECVKFLSDGQYLIRQKDKFLLTNRFYQDTVGLDIGVVVVNREDIAVREKVVKPKKTITSKGGAVIDVDSVNWVTLYQQFIMDAEIPRTGIDGRGGYYDLNKSTKLGREAFKNAMLEGAEYDKLLMAAKGYYKERFLKKKVENYFTQELWRDDYGKESANTPTHESNVISSIKFG